MDAAVVDSSTDVPELVAAMHRHLPRHLLWWCPLGLAPDGLQDTAAAAHQGTSTAAQGRVHLTTMDKDPVRLAKRENVAAAIVVIFTAAAAVARTRHRHMTTRERARLDHRASVVAARVAISPGAEESVAGTPYLQRP